MNKKVPGTLNQLRKEYPVLLGSGPAERACTDVNAGAFVHGRMSLELAAELTQSLQILHRDEAGQRQSRVLNRACVSSNSHLYRICYNLKITECIGWVNIVRWLKHEMTDKYGQNFERNAKRSDLMKEYKIV